jgi:hypothetical protein
MTDASATRPGTTAADDAPPGVVVDYQKLVSASVALFVASGAIALVEPSPYDFVSLVAMPLWFFGGFSVQRSFVLFGFLLIAYTITGFLALIPYWNNELSSLYMYQSAYLTLTSLFFALFTADRTQNRVEVIAKGYTAGAIIAATCALIGYFDVGGLGETFARWGRAAGTFKDPNVFGSFVIMGALYLAQNLIFARTRRVIPTIGLLAIIAAGIFLSFSRGSWAAAIFSMGLMMGSAFLTTKDRGLKRRISVTAVVAIAIGVIVVLVMLSMEETREIFLKRAAVTQDYDEGETGRFGNQMRSIPMLIEQFGGFGPLRFRYIFGLEPHNSYIGAFANGGWIGGFLYILIVGVTTFIGFRLMFKASPYQRPAQVVFPALLAFFLQAFQIDIDHWRHVLLMLGVVWGLEAARQKWEDRRALAFVVTPPQLRSSA